MIGIACYFDGEVLQGPNGAYYSHQMPKMFNIRLGLDFRGLNREVYQQLGIDHRNYELVPQGSILAKATKPSSNSYRYKTIAVGSYMSK